MSGERARQVAGFFASLVRPRPKRAEGQSPWVLGEFLDSWFSWREACEDVRSAYQLWRGAKPRQRDLAYEAYRAALEREEHTALLHSVWTHRLRVAEC